MMQTDSIPHQVADSAHSHPASVVHVQGAASVKGDSVTADTVAAAPKGFGICLTAPPTLVAQPRADDSLGMSCVVGVLALLFCIIGLRFRNNGKYITAMLRNMVEVRLRGNVFDETVSETSPGCMLIRRPLSVSAWGWVWPIRALWHWPTLRWAPCSTMVSTAACGSRGLPRAQGFLALSGYRSPCSSSFILNGRKYCSI